MAHQLIEQDNLHLPSEETLVVGNFKKLNMKKTLFLSVLFVLATFIGSAQKSAVVDTEYILEKMPDYASAQSKLNNLSKQWENQVNSMIQEVESLYKNYQADKVIMSEDMRAKREEEIAQKEREIAQFRKEKFGKNGALYQEREKLVKPIQDKVYEAIKSVAEKGRYAMIFDTASQLSVIYVDQNYDISDEVLKTLGY
jgi:outer membrane protein